jgi:DNA-binding NarL/FixJ family response regulator
MTLQLDQAHSGVSVSFDTHMHPPDSIASNLTSREQDVFHLVARGLSNREMAQALCITENTLESHLCSIYGKLGVKNRTQALLSYIITQSTKPIRGATQRKASA